MPLLARGAGEAERLAASVWNRGSDSGASPHSRKRFGSALLHAAPPCVSPPLLQTIYCWVFSVGRRSSSPPPPHPPISYSGNTRLTYHGCVLGLSLGLGHLLLVQGLLLLLLLHHQHLLLLLLLEQGLLLLLQLKGLLHRLLVLRTAGEPW